MTLNVNSDMNKRLRSSVKKFRPLGGLEVSNSLTGIGRELGREGHFVCCLELLRN